jgi:hypothetical protein
VRIFTLPVLGPDFRQVRRCKIPRRLKKIGGFDSLKFAQSENGLSEKTLIVVIPVETAS